MRSAVILVMLSFFVVQVAGCGSGAALEYGDAAAHFNEDKLLEKGEPYLGEKIVVKGTVTKHDITDPENSKVYLGHSICCNFGDLKKMAENCNEGDSIFVMGILKRLEDGDILLEPAMKRDPKAEFNPVE
ncbi:hypothetical protein DTL42_14230 [Bremerella cremea]|uniref:Uncharacterized protein n=1 Tax=Bremerella cremea TaxID=1031537 RepID=A0A368KPT6_9BACT|nr:hypothetical protein [Bremerella cremea]RCS47673.1 hypothetical protein DTL42_14230 [Bremerella cremea]